jgi:hypothetical protein
MIRNRKINDANAKRILSSGQVQSILKNVHTEEQVLKKMWEYIGKNQSQIGYDVVAMKAILPPELHKGEVEVTVQFNILDSSSKKMMYEMTWSRKLKKFNIDDQEPNMI